MPLIAEPQGVVVYVREKAQLLVSRRSVEFPQAFASIPLRDATELRLLAPSRRAVLARAIWGAIQMVLSVGGFPASGGPGLGMASRLEVRRSGDLDWADLYIPRTDRRQLQLLVAWVNANLGDEEALSLLESGRDFWSTASAGAP